MKAKKAADSVVVTLTVPPPPLPPSFLFVARFGQAQSWLLSVKNLQSGRVEKCFYSFSHIFIQ